MTKGHAEWLGIGQARSRVLLNQLLQYGVALLSVVLALGMTLLLGSYLRPTPSPLFFAAVMVSAWYGGLGPGLVATILSTIAINFALLEPVYVFRVPDLGTVVRLGIFVMIALLINSLNQAQRTAWRRAEANLKSLRDSDARFGCLAESNIIGTIVAELDGTLLDANQNFLQLVGYTREELRAGRLNWRDMTPPESIAISERAVQELLTTGVCTPFEKQYIRKDGSRVTVLHGAVMTGETTVTGFVLDLSEQKRIELIRQDAIRRERSLHAEVQAANAQLEMVLTSLKDQFLVLDQEWRYIYVSDRVIEVVSIDRDDLIGKCIWDLFPELVGSLFDTELRRAVAEQQIIQFEYFYSPWKRWFESRVYPSTAGVSILVTDITKRKQAEEALRWSEERLRVALKNSPITVFNQDQELRYTWIYNPTFEHYLTEAIGKQDQELLSEGDAAVLTRIKRHVLETGNVTREEVKLTLQGQDYYYDLTVEPLLDVNGETSGITCAAVNITEWKQMELALRQSETTLNALIASSPIGIAFFDRNLRYIHANEALAATNGIPLSQHIGRTLGEVLPEWAPMVAPILQSVMETREPLLNQEVVGVTHPSDVVRQGLVNYFPVCLTDGVVLGVGVTSVDISDRRQMEESLRQSEERYRAVYDQVLIGISQVDLTGKIIKTNDRFCEIIGRSHEELLTLWKQDITHPDDLPYNLVLFQRMIQDGTSFEIEKRYLRPDGSAVWVRNYVSLIRDADGQPQCGVVVTEDITTQKQAEIEREHLLLREKAAREEAETANRIKDEFLAVLSHELRSPLNPILGWSRLLQMQKLDEQTTQQALTTIERNAKLQTQLIEDLLDVSRILRGKLILNITPVSLISTVEAALETVRLAVEAKGIHIQKVFDLDVDQVMGDAARLQQVVWNLLTNAVKFTPSGGMIEIRLERVNHESRIQVRDTGKGIAPEFLPYVFDYFRQEDGTTTRKFGGLGLGLAIVRHITELHGGTVAVESPGEGLGATFTVQLPLIPISVNVTAKHESPAIANLTGLKVLAVDDDADIRTLIEFILQQAGAVVRVVASATEVLQQLETFSPDVLVSDIGMPGFDGYMLMRQIRTLAPTGKMIPAIALTAYASEADQQQAIASGFQMHLAKPVEPEKLVSAIVTVLHASRVNKG